MGILNVIRLANDYNKAKKLLEKKEIKVDEIRKVITSITKGVEYLKNTRTKLSELISKYNTIITKLVAKLKRRVK